MKNLQSIWTVISATQAGRTDAGCNVTEAANMSQPIPPSVGCSGSPPLTKHTMHEGRAHAN